MQFFSCLYDLNSPTVFKPGFTEFNHYILIAKLFSPIACNFILLLYLYLFKSHLLCLCRHNYAVFKIVSFLCCLFWRSAPAVFYTDDGISFYRNVCEMIATILAIIFLLKMLVVGFHFLPQPQ